MLHIGLLLCMPCWVVVVVWGLGFGGGGHQIAHFGSKMPYFQASKIWLRKVKTIFTGSYVDKRFKRRRYLHC